MPSLSRHLIQKQWQQAKTLINGVDSEEEPLSDKLALTPPAPQIKHFPRLEPRSTEAVVETAVDAADSSKSWSAKEVACGDSRWPMENGRSESPQLSSPFLCDKDGEGQNGGKGDEVIFGGCWRGRFAFIFVVVVFMDDDFVVNVSTFRLKEIS